MVDDVEGDGEGTQEQWNEYLNENTVVEDTGEGDGDKDDEGTVYIPSDDPAMKPFLSEDGTIDTAKLGKSYIEAQKMIGRTSGDREKMNKADDAIQQLQDAESFLENSPELLAHWNREVEFRKTGTRPEKATTPHTPEDLDDKVGKQIRDGKFQEGILTAIDPKLAELQKQMNNLLAKQEATAERTADLANEDAINRELSDFYRNHLDDGLFIKDGEDYVVNDAELMETLNKEIKGNPSLTFENAHILSCHKLGRSLKKGKTPAANKRVVARSKAGVSKTPQIESSEYKEFEGLNAEWFGKGVCEPWKPS